MGLDAANRFLTDNFISGKVISRDNKAFLISTIFVDEITTEYDEFGINFEDEDFMEEIAKNHLDHIIYLLRLVGASTMIVPKND